MVKTRVLVVDDLRTPAFRADIARGNDSAMAYLDALVAGPDHDRYLTELWLDYHLGFHVTTAPLAHWLAANASGDRPITIGYLLLHSNDPAGRSELRSILAGHFECSDAVLPRRT